MFYLSLHRIVAKVRKDLIFNWVILSVNLTVEELPYHAYFLCDEPDDVPSAIMGPHQQLLLHHCALDTAYSMHPHERFKWCGYTVHINTTTAFRINQHTSNILTCVEEQNRCTAGTERHFECLSDTLVVQGKHLHRKRSSESLRDLFSAKFVEYFVGGVLDYRALNGTRSRPWLLR